MQPPALHQAEAEEQKEAEPEEKEKVQVWAFMGAHVLQVSWFPGGESTLITPPDLLPALEVGTALGTASPICKQLLKPPSTHPRLLQQRGRSHWNTPAGSQGMEVWEKKESINLQSCHL